MSALDFSYVQSDVYYKSMSEANDQYVFQIDFESPDTYKQHTYQLHVHKYVFKYSEDVAENIGLEYWLDTWLKKQTISAHNRVSLYYLHSTIGFNNKDKLLFVSTYSSISNAVSGAQRCLRNNSLYFDPRKLAT